MGHRVDVCYVHKKLLVFQPVIYESSSCSKFILIHVFVRIFNGSSSNGPIGFFFLN